MHNLRHVLNEWRQKLVFHKDVYTHYLRYGFRQDVCVPAPKEQLVIPKIVHLCWFGRGKYPKIVEKCISSWKKVLPDYKIMIWNEDNFPFEKYPFAQQAFRDKKWAFVADVARLHALYTVGGIYLDTDIEVLKSFDEFLKYDYFAGFESRKHLSSGVIGAKKRLPFVRYLLQWYCKERSARDYYEIAITKITTNLTKLVTHVDMNDTTQMIFSNGIYFSRDYFYPKKIAGQFNIGEHTYTIHHGTGLW